MKSSTENPKKNVLKKGAVSIIQFVLVLVFLIGAIFLAKNLNRKRDRVPLQQNNEYRPLVHALEIQPTTRAYQIKSTGVVEARSHIAITSQISGRVTWINDKFYQGGHFDKHNILFRIEDSDFKNDVQRLEAEILKAQSTLDIEQAESEVSIAEWVLMNPDQPAPDLVARGPQIRQAQAELAARRSALDQAKLNLKRTQFSFPFSGRVVHSQIALGSYVQAGQSYGEVYDREQLEVITKIRHADLIKLGDSKNIKAQIQFRNKNQTNSYHGSIERVGANLDPTTRFVELVIRMTNPSTEILPGMLTTIELKGRNYDNIWMLPLAAIQENQKIWFIDDNKMIRSRTVEPLFSKQNAIAVIGEAKTILVVDAPLVNGVEGMTVRVDKGQ